MITNENIVIECVTAASNDFYIACRRGNWEQTVAVCSSRLLLVTSLTCLTIQEIKITYLLNIILDYTINILNI